ncbi:MAG: glycosyltransferase [Alphaproteobacteria bacterium]|nr:glycosyltransferase [Alphaproteobacteria bacterium]
MDKTIAEMDDVRLIAFYLPQFHPIEENDQWWGKGFTEWTNVSAAKPLFPGHDQPRIPADLGFYDLRLPEVREEQARLARTYGIHGFCYYYYYFNGKRLLNRPLDEVISSGNPDFPFCLCWANENWTRRWDGYDKEILIEQVHTKDGDRDFIREILPALTDKRYIRVGNKLLLLVYRAELLPDPKLTAKTWRDFVRKNTSDELYLCAVNSHKKNIDPRLLGFDGVVQFPFDYTPQCIINPKLFAGIHGIDPLGLQDNLLINYPGVVNHFVHLKKPDFPFFRGVFPGWDNTPRRSSSSTIFLNSSPGLYKLFLKTVLNLTRKEYTGDEQLVFINAWNEWAEGAYLEPDKKNGLRYLEATKAAIIENDDLEKLLNEVATRDSESKFFYSLAGQMQNRFSESEEINKELSTVIEEQNKRFEGKISVLEHALAEKDEQLRQLINHLEQNEIRLSEKENQLQDKEIQLREQATQILTGNNRTHELDLQCRLNEIHLKDMNSRIEELESRLRTKEHQTLALEKLLTEKEELSRRNESLINEKQALIESKDRLIHETESALAEKEVTIDRQLLKIDEQASMLDALRAEVVRLNGAVQAYLDSFSWKVTGPLRWIYSQLFTLFYFFCPYGSKRWLLVKTSFRMARHPVLYLKNFNTRTISDYLNILRHSNLVSYNKKVEDQDDVKKKPKQGEVTIPKDHYIDDFPLVTDCSEPVILFCIGTIENEEHFISTISSLITHAGVPFRIVVLDDQKCRYFKPVKNIDHIGREGLFQYLSRFSSLTHICFLNAGTVIFRETISSCIRTLDSKDKSSMVVPCVLDDRGGIESTGVIIWSDGSYSQIGHGESQWDPEHLYLRATDSGDHFAMITKDLFCLWLGGRTMLSISWPYWLHDLAMFIRQSGSKVLYQPQAKVTSALTIDFQGAQEAQSEFYKKWRRDLTDEHFPMRIDNFFRAREHGKGMPYMLMIDHYLPTFDQDAGSRTMQSYMEMLVDQDIILKFMGDNFYPEEKYITYFQQKGIEILYGRFCEQNWLKWLKEHGSDFNYIFISRPRVALNYLKQVKEFTKAKIIFYGHDLHYLREQRQFELEGKGEILESAIASRAMEQQVFESVDVIYYPSSVEIERIRSDFNLKNITRAIVPFIFSDFPARPYEIGNRNDLLFVGGFYHQPNCDAVLWFLDEVFPEVCKAIPGIKYYIAGSHPTDEILSRASEQVIITGFVTDAELTELYRKCRMVVAPLRYGAGIKGKIVEAMYHGLPVVTTTVGAEGLDGADSILLLADEPNGFARQLIRHYDDEPTLQQISRKSLEFVKDNFSKEKAFSIINRDLGVPKNRQIQKITPGLKILFISHDATLGGAQLLLLSMLRWFRAHTAMDIRIMCNKGGELLNRFREVACTMVFSDLERQGCNDEKKGQIILEFCDGKPDLIYGNSVAAGQSYYILREFGVPILTHFHELQQSIDYYAGSFIGEVIRYSSGFIAASEAVAANLKNNIKVPLEVVRVIHEFVEDLPVQILSKKDKKELRNKLGLEPEKFIVIGCGVGLFWRKGGDLFIEIADQVRKHRLDDFHFYWIGAFDETEKRSKYGFWDDHVHSIKTRDLDRHVTFLGRKEQVTDYLRAGDLFILPSREDPFPLVCLEAAQNGLPVICFSDAGGMPEFVEEDAGYIVPFEDSKAMADRVVTLYRNPELLHRLGARAQQKLKSHYTVPIAVPCILSACRTIAGKAPKVSVIVPNYNYGRFLRQRLESISAQTFQDFEIIILDDASDDNSSEIIAQFSQEHEVHVITNKENSGSVFRQWYKGLSHATADIVWMAEADDLSDPSFLENMLPLLNDPGVNLAYCNSKVIDDQGHIIENFYFNTGYYDGLPGDEKWKSYYVSPGCQEINDGLGIKNIIPNASAVLFRRSSIMHIDSEELFSFRCAGDWYIYLNIIRSAKIAYNPNSLNFHRRHRESVVGRSVKTAEETIPDYFKIHKFVIGNFNINEVTLSLQFKYVLEELRRIWPDVGDEMYYSLYDPGQLKQLFLSRTQSET